ncbi:hypothetical protein DFH11DRAFT_1499380, partial [Phellopilus nigrolimitatus]
SPPDRGSFPLDHDGECKEQMKAYLACLQQNGASSTPCRIAGKGYLECRMTKGLMERDEWRNLGMNNVDKGSAPSDTASPPSQSAEGTTKTS